MAEGLIGLGAMLLLMVLRVPIALAMGLVGFVGLTVSGPHPAMISNTLANNVLTINPLQEVFDGFVNAHTGNNSSNNDALASLAAARIWSFSA